jgi:uncharacterized membrane protein YtjA (UPF0391 family)
VLNLIIVLAVVWVVAGILGFTGVAGAAGAALQLLFWVALALILISVAVGLLTGRAIFR